ncbi:MAG: hypothetical protein Q4G22_11935 [Paracoccus sp. (in: a-proteobacteria)]|uniref:hypothetical protein n=1 Tax=Paracoccus sp. TaxID=267 RepID=UPI0026E039AF|nr:hypothetical protein [Paracoccus sp. (in: a-proteobacteria)]MDO5632532.1 hypothetical protein [Paracoccus sp. (in: a-proteobacteria)]
MKDDIALARLEGVPASVRDSLMLRRANLPAGAISGVARFFACLAERGEDPSAPSRATFDAACGSESTLAKLVKTLSVDAPDVCLSEARELRKEYYRKRPNGSKAPCGSARKTKATVFPRNWPADWLALLPGLRHAPIKQSSISCYINAINRCADVLGSLSCPPRLGWLLAWQFSVAVQAPNSATGKPGVNARTAASYLGALIGLGLHGGLHSDALDGMRAVQAHLQRQGRRLPKAKEGRIEVLYERRGYDEIMRILLEKLEEADMLPDWTAAAETARATAAILAVTTNDPARTGDVSGWILGEELVRQPTGSWQLRWRQEKTNHWKVAGTLWPEIGRVIDEHILGGRPARHVQRRYDELRGRNWLSLSDHVYASNWPSQQVKDAVGIPLHDLRTLAADYLRLHHPADAPRIVSVLLGHRSMEAGTEYRALCVETAAQQEWRTIRADHVKA